MLLVVFALPAEARVFQQRLEQKTKRDKLFCGNICGTTIGICFVGIRATAIGDLEETIRRVRPPLVISSGFAGAARVLLEPGDFLLASNYSSAELRLASGSVVDAVGKFHSVDQISGPSEKQRLGLLSVAVDMESATIAGACERYRTPLITARMISDGRDENIPAVFTGGKLRNPRDLIAAGQFAIRMLHLTRLLADRLTQLICFTVQSDERLSGGSTPAVVP
jgi:nucleoside phosphorylase